MLNQVVALDPEEGERRGGGNAGSGNYRDNIRGGPATWTGRCEFLIDAERVGLIRDIEIRK